MLGAGSPFAAYAILFIGLIGFYAAVSRLDPFGLTGRRLNRSLLERQNAILLILAKCCGEDGAPSHGGVTGQKCKCNGKGCIVCLQNKGDIFIQHCGGSKRSGRDDWAGALLAGLFWLFVLALSLFPDRPRLQHAVTACPRRIDQR